MRERRIFAAFVLAAALFLSGCTGHRSSGGTGPSPTPGPGPNQPDVFPPGPPINIPQGSSLTSVKMGFFTVSEMIVEPGPGSVIRDGNSWSVKFRITMDCEAPDQFGFGFFPVFGPVDENGKPFPPNSPTLFNGSTDGRTIRPCESGPVSAGGPIFSGGGIMDVPNLIIQVRIGQNGEIGWLQGADFSIERAIVRVNLKKAG